MNTGTVRWEGRVCTGPGGIFFGVIPNLLILFRTTTDRI